MRVGGVAERISGVGSLAICFFTHVPNVMMMMRRVCVMGVKTVCIASYMLVVAGWRAFLKHTHNTPTRKYRQ